MTDPTRTALDAAGYEPKPVRLDEATARPTLLDKIEHYVDCVVAYQDGATHHNDVENAKADVKASLASERAVLEQAKGALAEVMKEWREGYGLRCEAQVRAALTAIEALEKGEGK